MPDSLRQGERLAVLEERMNRLEEGYEQINVKLDALLSIKDKGMGVFWLASSLFGSSLILAVYYIVDMFKHK